MHSYDPTWFDWLTLLAATVPVGLTFLFWRLDRKQLIRQAAHERRAAIVREYSTGNQELLKVAENMEGRDRVDSVTVFRIISRTSLALGLAGSSERDAALWFSGAQDEVARRLLQDGDTEGGEELLGNIMSELRMWLADPGNPRDWERRVQEKSWVKV